MEKLKKIGKWTKENWFECLIGGAFIGAVYSFSSLCKQSARSYYSYLDRTANQQEEITNAVLYKLTGYKADEDIK